MAKSNSEPASPHNSVHNASKGGGRRNGAASHNNDSNASLDTEYGVLVDQAKAWVEDNQTAAMIGGFGFGVFIGVLLRR